MTRDSYTFSSRAQKISDVMPQVGAVSDGMSGFFPGYEDFKREFLLLTGIDLHSYKEKQMKRRIDTFIARKGFSGYGEYLRELKENPSELAHFEDYITINVTEFFRKRDHWSFFEETALKELTEQKHDCLKIWSCACATGEEPYSAVMSTAEYLPLDQIRVLASDLDMKVLAQAERGVFSDKSMENVADDMKQKYFLKADDGWHISDEVKQCVKFSRLDLLKDEYPQEQDLIICRNVLIYFTEEAKREILLKFYDSLAPGGYLFTGNAEQIIRYKEFGFTKQSSFIYKKAHIA